MTSKKGNLTLWPPIQTSLGSAYISSNPGSVKISSSQGVNMNQR